MIPILFPSDATDFTTQGLGALSAANSCTVTEERNGMYELELVYPMTGVHFSEIQDDCLIFAIPSPYRSPQPFRIYRHTKPMGGKVTFYAQHISYDLLGVPLNPCTAGSAPAAMVALQSNVAIPSPFVYWTDKDTVAQWSVKVPSASRSVLGGQEGSILDVYGGEYEWDGYTVKLHQERGRDNGVTIRYGKNLTDINQDRNISNVITGIYPYWTDTNGENLVVCDPPIIHATGTYERARVAPVDFSADFDEAPTPEQLQARAETYVVANQIGVPTVSITVSFVQLEQAMGYEDLALLEKVDLCDTVTVQYEALGVDATAKVIQIETDVLRGRYNKVTLGDAKSTLADTILSQGQEIQQRPTQSDLQQAITNATKWITNGKGYMVPIFGSDGSWSELCSLDRQSLTEAQNVWRWNNAGFGHSSAGYNGPYRTAITQDGHIVADFVDVGTLIANIIKAGVLSSKDGKTFVLDLDNGTLDMEATSLTITGRTVDSIAQELANGAEENAKSYTDTEVSKGVEEAVTIAENHVDAAIAGQTQQDIFNKLTNNGALQGLYMQDGKLYINAEYLAAGVIASKDGSSTWDLVNGIISLMGTFTSKSDVSTLKAELDQGSLRIKDGDNQVVNIGASLGGSGYSGGLALFGPGGEITDLSLTDLILGGHTVITIQNNKPTLQVTDAFIGGSLTVSNGAVKNLQWKAKSSVLDSDMVLTGRN